MQARKDYVEKIILEAGELIRKKIKEDLTINETWGRFVCHVIALLNSHQTLYFVTNNQPLKATLASCAWEFHP